MPVVPSASYFEEVTEAAAGVVVYPDPSFVTSPNDSNKSSPTEQDNKLEVYLTSTNLKKINIMEFNERGRKVERVLAEYEDFLSLSDPTDPTRPDRPSFQRLISFEPSYRLANGFRYRKATFNK